MSTLVARGSQNTPRSLGSKVKAAVAGIAIAVMATVAVPASASAMEAPAAPEANSSPASAVAPTSESPSQTVAPDGLGIDGMQAAATGDYEYVCVGIDGNSYSMAQGEPTWNCKGSYLQKYLDGRQLAVYSLDGAGNPASTPPFETGCVLAVASGVALFVFPPTGAVAWVVVGGLTAAGLYVSCVA